MLDPLDSLFVHLILELVPGFPVLVDLAAEPTGGASSVLGLAHPHVQRVLAVTGAVDRSLAALRGYVRGRAEELASLELVRRGDLSDQLDGQARVVFLADVRDADPVALADDLTGWLDVLPDALVLLLNTGPVGDCPALEVLQERCGRGSTRRLRLIRDLGEVLGASRMAVVARRDHPYADDVLLRLQLMYDGNHHFLDLIRSVNQTAMQAADVDSEVMKTHPSSGPLRSEIEHLKRAAHESREQAEAARQALEATAVELEHLRWRVRELADQTVGVLSMTTILRHKLSPGVVGKLYRASKRLARKGLARRP